jgi:hypothetical protein
LAKNNFVSEPMSNWGRWIAKKDGRNLGYSQGDAQKGVKIKQRGRAKRSPWSGVLQIRNESAVGAIFEMAGRKQQPSNAQGSKFIANMQDIFEVNVKGLSRGIWKAIKEWPASRYTEIVQMNYYKAEEDLQKVMNSLGKSL